MAYEFTDKPCSLTQCITDEQLLDFVLEYLNMFSSDEECNPIANKILINYVVKDFQSQKKEHFTAEDVQKQCNELIFMYVMKGLVDKGFAEVDFTDGTYTLTKDKNDDSNS